MINHLFTFGITGVGLGENEFFMFMVSHGHSCMTSSYVAAEAFQGGGATWWNI